MLEVLLFSELIAVSFGKRTSTYIHDRDNSYIAKSGAIVLCKTGLCHVLCTFLFTFSIGDFRHGADR